MLTSSIQRAPLSLKTLSHAPMAALVPCLTASAFSNDAQSEADITMFHHITVETVRFTDGTQEAAAGYASARLVSHASTRCT